MQLMKSYKNTAEASGSGFDMDPSPGNIKDGLVTDAMKSAGAAKKGDITLETILDYVEFVRLIAAGLSDLRWSAPKMRVAQ